MNPDRYSKHCLLKNLILVFAICLAGAGLSCSSSTRVEGGLPDHDPQLAQRLVKEEGALLLDVRTPGEFLSGRLPGSRNLPIEQLPQRIHEIEQILDGDKTLPIVVYCSAGVRAARAKQILLKAGFNKVTNLGSLRNWPSGN
jgi:rhodanese-related sulfurtransferase